MQKKNENKKIRILGQNVERKYSLLRIMKKKIVRKEKNVEESELEITKKKNGEK